MASLTSTSVYPSHPSSPSPRWQAHMLAAKAVLAFSRFGKLSLAERMAATAEAAAKDGEPEAAAAGEGVDVSAGAGSAGK